MDEEPIIKVVRRLNSHGQFSSEPTFRRIEAEREQTLATRYEVYRWNGGAWHQVIGSDPNFPDLSANTYLACGWRGARGVPEALQIAVGEVPPNACKKCFPTRKGG